MVHIPSSPGLYVPIHRRTPSAASSSGTPTPLSSPTSSSRALSPTLSTSTSIPGVYTPAELLALSRSPMVAQLAVVDALRAVAPEVVQTRRQRKALAWHARQSSRTPAHAHARSSSHSSESEEERSVSWRKM